ncbi:hypothetical protein AMQ83_04140 [Paenibacillus riograndensis]|nr:hypothetical protein AMQ83_04140 [Paenibacillus riograndensis]
MEGPGWRGGGEGQRCSEGASWPRAWQKGGHGRWRAAGRETTAKMPVLAPPPALRLTPRTAAGSKQAVP